MPQEYISPLCANECYLPDESLFFWHQKRVHYGCCRGAGTVPAFRIVLCSFIVVILPDLILADKSRTGTYGRCSVLKGHFIQPSSSLLPTNVCDLFSPFFLMAAQLDVLIKVEILNASHSENTEWNMRLISRLGSEFSQEAGVVFFFF